jgi:cell division protein DivIC
MAKLPPFQALFSKKNAYVIAYVIIGGLFLIWMLFLDSHSWLIHRELNQEIEELNGRKSSLQQAIQEDKTTIEQLENPDSLEKFARENYGHKREEETIFIVED